MGLILFEIMKQYDELSYEEKVELLKDALDKWKRHEEGPYKNLLNKYHVAGICLWLYYIESNNLELTVTVNPPAEWQEDICGIMKTLDI